MRSLRYIVAGLAVVFWSVTGRTQVAINELMYAPASPEPEWVELLNAGQTAIQLGGWKISDPSKSATLPSFELPAGGYVVLTSDTSQLRARYSHSFALLKVALPSLNNTGDVVVLRDAAGVLIDSVSFRSSWGGKQGSSLERLEAGRASQDSSNWSTCLDATHGTPGSINSRTPRAHDLALTSLALRFTSDGSAILSVSVKNVGKLTSSACTIPIAEGLSEISSIAIAPLAVGDSTHDSTTLHIGAAATTLIATIHSAEDERQSNDSLSFAVPSGGEIGSVLLSEVMAYPTSPEPEWIELFNPTSREVTMNDWKLMDASGAKASIVLTIPAQSFAIVTRNDSLLKLSRLTDVEGAERNDIPIISALLPSLNNDMESITILDPRGVAIDSVQYLHAVGGTSVERFDHRKPFAGANDLLPSRDSSGATLGRENSNRRRNFDLAISSIDARGDSTARVRVTVVNRGYSSITLNAVQVNEASYTVPVAMSASPILVAQLDTTNIDLEWRASIGQQDLTAIINSASDEIPENDTLRVSFRTPCATRDLVIAEIMPSPLTGSSQWIEVFNSTDRDLQLRNLELRTAGASAAYRTRSLPASIVGPHSYGVIAANATFLTTYPELSLRKEVVLLGSSDLGFSADAGRIVIREPDSTGALLDSVAYLESWFNPLLSDHHGVSLERKRLEVSSTDSANWVSSSDEKGATPLHESSGQSVPETHLAGAVTIEPNPFSPLSTDARACQISLRLASDEPALVDAELFDRAGRTVRHLAERRAVEQTLDLVFDGKMDNGLVTPLGLYTLVVNVFNERGERVNTFRKGIGIR